MTFPGEITNEVSVYFRRWRRFLCILCVASGMAAAVGGCGQKGDLYLPHDKPKNMLQP